MTLNRTPSLLLSPTPYLAALALCFAQASCAKTPTRSAALPAAVEPASQLAPPKVSELARPVLDVEEDTWSPIQDDFPYQASVVTAPYPKGNTTNKSISVRLHENAACNFDTDLLRFASAWTGAYLTATGVTFDTSHGGHPQVAGNVALGTAPGPGWADARGNFNDPRPIPYGPLPEKWARWDGLYTVGNDVVFAYTVHGTKVHEWNSVVNSGERVGFVRTLALAPTKLPLATRLFDLIGTVTATGEGLQRSYHDDRGTTHVAVVGAPEGTQLKDLGEGKIALSLPKTKTQSVFKIVVNFGAAHEQPGVLTPLLAGEPGLPVFQNGGPAHWPNPIVTKGQLGSTSGAYVVDRITTPYPGVYKGAPEDWKDNVFRRRIMIAGLDFFSDGTRAAVSTWEGDVWVVSGIDESLERLQWRRYASGLFEPLGLKIIGDVVYVTGRDQLTRLHDLNNDGEADYYENFNNQVTNSPGFHEFQFDLQTDKQGNFYTVKAGPVRGGGRGFGGGGGNGEITPMAGALHKISKDGKHRSVFATGFRAPNGIGIGPNNEITTGDNEGTWMPSSPINWVREGGFYGVETLAHRKPIPEPDKPLAWLSKSYDNSGGGQVWVTSDRWGPLKGELLHLSYGRASIYHVLKEKVGKQMQGGVVRLVGGSDTAQFTGEPTKLTSSAMRAKFNAKDGQLYVVGLSGWQSDAVSLTGFDRIRYTGKEVHTVSGLNVTSAGVHLTFSHPLDPASVIAENFSGERWNYKRSEDYGSPEYSVEEPNRRGHDRLDIFDATLSKDGRTVSLSIDDLRPVHQMLLKFKLAAADGTPVAQTVMHTVHVVPKDPKARSNAGVATRLRPGLKLSVSGPQAKIADVDVVPGVQLYVAKGNSASPLAGPGAFSAIWEGTLQPELPGNHVLAVEANGPVEVFFDGKIVLAAQAAGMTRSKPVLLPGKPTPLRVVYKGDSRGQDNFVRLLWANANPERAGKEWLSPVPGNVLRHQPTPDVQVSSKLHFGRELFLENRCGSCHLGKIPEAAAPELAMDTPSFNGIGSRRNWHWMKSWIQDPKGMRASARMPRMFEGKESQDDVEAIAAYLSTLRDDAEDRERNELAAAITTKREHAATSPSKTASKIFGQYLCNGCHPDMAQAADDGRIMLNLVAFKFPQGALAAYLQTPSAHYAWNPMPDFRLTRDEAIELEMSLTQKAWAAPLPQLPQDPAVFARGKQLVQNSGCLACHALSNTANAAATLDLTTRAKGKGGNCIDGTGPANYLFHDNEREALKDFLKNNVAAVFNHAPAEFFERQSRNLRCTGCHGKFDGFPSLDGLGEKLRPEWTAGFIASRVPYKPRSESHPDGHAWLTAKMPAFKTRAKPLAEGMAAAAGLPPVSPLAGPVNQELARVGAQLISADGGFSCIGCHAVGKQPATQVFEAEGINLAYSAERLRHEYFQHWVRNPLKMDPQTKMPTYFDDSGTSPLDGILEGDADKQIEAMWQFVRALQSSSSNGVAGH